MKHKRRFVEDNSFELPEPKKLNDNQKIKILSIIIGVLLIALALVVFDHDKCVIQNKELINIAYNCTKNCLVYG